MNFKLLKKKRKAFSKCMICLSLCITSKRSCWKSVLKRNRGTKKWHNYYPFCEMQITIIFINRNSKRRDGKETKMVAILIREGYTNEMRVKTNEGLGR